MRPTQIFEQTCQECFRVSFVFFIPAEEESEIYPLPCDYCGSHVKLREAHPENIPDSLKGWQVEAQRATS